MHQECFLKALIKQRKDCEKKCWQLCVHVVSLNHGRRLLIWITLLYYHSDSLLSSALWNPSHVSLFKHEFVPLLNRFTWYLVIFSAFYKASIVLPVPLGERERASIPLLFFLLFFRLSFNSLAKEVQTHIKVQNWLRLSLKTSCMQLFAWFANTCFASELKNVMFLPR